MESQPVEDESNVNLLDQGKIENFSKLDSYLLDSSSDNRRISDRLGLLFLSN